MLEFVRVFGQSKVICNDKELLNSSIIQRVKLPFNNIRYNGLFRLNTIIIH